jgi:hypothetical protein
LANRRAVAGVCRLCWVGSCVMLRGNHSRWVGAWCVCERLPVLPSKHRREFALVGEGVEGSTGGRLRRRLRSVVAVDKCHWSSWVVSTVRIASRHLLISIGGRLWLAAILLCSPCLPRQQCPLLGTEAHRLFCSGGGPCSTGLLGRPFRLSSSCGQWTVVLVQTCVFVGYVLVLGVHGWPAWQWTSSFGQ